MVLGGYCWIFLSWSSWMFVSYDRQATSAIFMLLHTVSAYNIKAQTVMIMLLFASSAIFYLIFYTLMSGLL